MSAIKMNEAGARILRNKLGALSAADPECTLFASQSHRYCLGRPLSPAEITDFEATFGVTLPEEYAFFLTHIGNGGLPISAEDKERLSELDIAAQLPESNDDLKGIHAQHLIHQASLFNNGAGPGYGLIPLGHWDQFLVADDPWHIADSIDDSLFEPDTWAAAVEKLNTLPMDNDVTYSADWWEMRKSLQAGQLFIADYGGDDYRAVILSGKHRGAVISASRDLDPTIPPEIVTPDFLTWYQNWLDSAMTKVDSRVNGSVIG
ncbi:MAG: SMI1/KNR4 family protein [Actinomycetaceae bacterium]|nr:SMI1/KNR4 family protein [Actinomycetaceae bacterium]